MAQKHPWERREKEPESAYQAFLAYRDQGPGRSLDRVADDGREMAGNSGRNLRRLAARYQWDKRVAAWDAWLQKERDRIARTEAAKWERRRLRALETVYEDAQILRERLRKMMGFPLSRSRVEEQNGQRITIVEPVRWGWREIVLGLKALAEIEAMVLTAATRPAEQLSDAELAGVLDATGPAGIGPAGGGGVG